MRNQAERAIQTFKSHFISILAGADDKFPLSLWCHLLEPAELTLNLLRLSRVAPNVSAFAYVHGNHNYMRKPFAPIGCAIQTHVKPDDRLSWDTQSEPGFNLGTSMEHHICFRVYATRTRATRTSDTVFFKNQYITNPAISPESHVVAAAQQLARGNGAQGHYPDRQRDGGGIGEGEQIIHKNSSGKTGSSNSKRTAKQTQGKSGSLDNNSPSKGGRTTSKGGRPNSKGGRTPPG